jgi:hypothetical protein
MVSPSFAIVSAFEFPFHHALPKPLGLCHDRQKVQNMATRFSTCSSVTSVASCKKFFSCLVLSFRRYPHRRPRRPSRQHPRSVGPQVVLCHLPRPILSHPSHFAFNHPTFRPVSTYFDLFRPKKFLLNLNRIIL